MAAAIATALVSDPPRPRVETRAAGRNALKARNYRHLAPGKARFQQRWRQYPECAPNHAHPTWLIGNCQPIQERAGTPDFLQRQRQQPGRHLFAGRHHHIIFALVREFWPPDWSRPTS